MMMAHKCSDGAKHQQMWDFISENENDDAEW